MGGEEFAVLLVDSDVEQTLEYAERLRAAYGATVPGYAAKRAGRNQTAVDSRLDPELAPATD